MALTSKLNCPNCFNLCNEEAKFCGTCGMQIPLFCSDCGSKMNDCICNDKKKKKTLSLDQYLEAKGKQRTSSSSSSLFPPKPSKDTLRKSKSSKNVTINIGLMKPDGFGELKKERGVWVHISVPPSADAETVQNHAITKHASVNQFFCGLDDYVLLYPDQKICDKLLPQAMKSFLWKSTKYF